MFPSHRGGGGGSSTVVDKLYMAGRHLETPAGPRSPSEFIKVCYPRTRNNELYICRETAGRDDLEGLMCAYEHGFEWDRDTCTWAADAGSPRCLKYAHENGCPWDEMTCYSAALRDHPDCLKYAHENGCPWDGSALNSNHTECFQYAKAHGLVGGSASIQNAHSALRRSGDTPLFRPGGLSQLHFKLDIPLRGGIEIRVEVPKHGKEVKGAVCGPFWGSIDPADEARRKQTRVDKINRTVLRVPVVDREDPHWRRAHRHIHSQMSDSVRSSYTRIDEQFNLFDNCTSHPAIMNERYPD